MVDWLIDETKPLSAADAEREAQPRPVGFDERRSVPVAVQITDLTVRNIRKRFGSAKIRLDTLIQTVPRRRDRPSELYAASTIRFPDVRDGDRIDIESGIGVYLGYPQRLLDVRIQLSRDETDSPDLVELLAASSDQMTKAASPLLELAGGLPYGAAVAAGATAVGAAANLGLKLLASSTGRTIGLYANTWWAERNDFGVGRHPARGRHLRDDMELAYEIFRDTAPGSGT
jgi:hypothetical protein